MMQLLLTNIIKFDKIQILFMANIIDSIRDFLFGNNDLTWLDNRQLGQKEVVYIPVNKPRDVYSSIPELRQVIDKRAKMQSNCIIKMQNVLTGEIKMIDNDELNRLLEKPNPLQSQNDWLRNQVEQYLVYGNQFIYGNRPSRLSKYPTTLYNISPKYMSPLTTGKVFDQVDMSGIYSGFLYDDSSVHKTYEAKDILYTKNTDIDNPTKGESLLLSLVLPLTNTKLAYEYRNVIMGEKGAIGMLTNQSTDQMGPVPMKRADKKRIEKQYRENYGIQPGKSKILMMEGNVKWDPMTYPTKDLLLFEEVDANKLTICDHFGLNINLFSSKSQTFENVKNAIKQVYQDTIQPETDSFLQALGNWLGIDKGWRLVATFEHIPLMQDDEKAKADTIAVKVDSITKLVAGGIITPDMAITLINDVYETEVKIGRGIIDEINRLSPLVSNNVVQQMTVNELRKIINLPFIAGGDIPLSQTSTVTPNVSTNI